MKTEQGDIYSDFDVAFIRTLARFKRKIPKGGVYKVVVDEWKRGDINGGGPEITLRNYNGDIFIRKKKVGLIIEKNTGPSWCFF